MPRFAKAFATAPLCLALFCLALFCFASSAYAADAGKAALGKDTFRSYCASCHGPAGKGDGSIASMLKVPPGDLTVLAQNHDGTFPAERTRKIIDGREKVKGHGTSDMPAWGDAFQAVEENEEAVTAKIDQLVHYLESIQVGSGS